MRAHLDRFRLVREALLRILDELDADAGRAGDGDEAVDVLRQTE